MFEWDELKNIENTKKHSVSFEQAVKVFDDNKFLILDDKSHSAEEERFFCIGEVNGKIMTVRFTTRGDAVRIIGAGYWRKGKKLYEKNH